MLKELTWAFGDWVPAVPIGVMYIKDGTITTTGWFTVWDGREEVSWWVTRPTLSESAINATRKI